MSLEFFNPWVLLGLVAIAISIVASMRSFTGLGRVQGKLHLTLRILTKPSGSPS